MPHSARRRARSPPCSRSHGRLALARDSGRYTVEDAFSTGADDRAIIEALRKLVGYGERRDYFAKSVVLRADEARNYYVQFAVDEGGLFCEVVHNKYLAPEHAFTGDDIAKLLALGFEAPDHEDQNLYRVFQPASEEDYAAIVSVVRTVVTDFFGCRQAGDLRPAGGATRPPRRQAMPAQAAVAFEVRFAASASRSPTEPLPVRLRVIPMSDRREVR